MFNLEIYVYTFSYIMRCYIMYNIYKIYNIKSIFYIQNYIKFCKQQQRERERGKAIHRKINNLKIICSVLIV